MVPTVGIHLKESILLSEGMLEHVSCSPSGVGFDSTALVFALLRDTSVGFCRELEFRFNLP